MIRKYLIAVLGILLADSPVAFAVPVKYIGEVDLSAYACQTTPESSLVRSICHGRAHPNVVVSLTGSWYGYCGVPGSVVQDWLQAPSKGSYYNAVIKGRFDCRSTR